MAHADDVGEGGAVGGVAAEAAGDQGAQGVGEPAEVGVLVDDAVEDGVRGAVAVGGRADRGVGGDLAEGEDVGGRGDGADRRLLGRHERRGADADAGAGEGGGVGGPGDAEVDHPGPVGGQQDVRGLQVTVDDPRTMDDTECLRHPDGQQQHAPQRQPAVPGDRVRERGARHVGRRQPRLRPLGVRVDDRRGVQALHPLRGPYLLLETPPELRILTELRPDHLDRERTATGRVREIHLAHPARAQHGGQPIAPHNSRIVGLERLERVGRRCAAH